VGAISSSISFNPAGPLAQVDRESRLEPKNGVYGGATQSALVRCGRWLKEVQGCGFGWPTTRIGHDGARVAYVVVQPQVWTSGTVAARIKP
jgi:hypothetical protein